MGHSLTDGDQRRIASIVVSLCLIIAPGPRQRTSLSGLLVFTRVGLCHLSSHSKPARRTTKGPRRDQGLTARPVFRLEYLLTLKTIVSR